jgi:two-component system nitrate/nitrite response regulator NarL
MPTSSPNSSPIRILVVDDHTLFRRGLTALLTSDAGLQAFVPTPQAGPTPSPGSAQ